jgi:tetratricopeptide (TPR) repeat protein
MAMLEEEYGQAVEYLRKAYFLDPENIDIQYSLASTLRDNKEFTEALVFYEDIARVSPEYPNLHNDKGEIYENRGDAARAEQEFQKEKRIVAALLSGDPGNNAARVRLARAYNGLGEPEQALEMLMEIIAVEPGNREAYYARSQVYEKRGDISAAYNDIQKARSLVNVSADAGVPASSGRPENGALVTVPELTAEGVPVLEEDTEVVLTNGNVMRGRLKKETEDTLILEIRLGNSYGTIGFKKSRIRTLKKLK